VGWWREQIQHRIHSFNGVIGCAEPDFCIRPEEFLRMAIIRIQAAEDLDWDQACGKAVALLDQNSMRFKNDVQVTL